MLHTNICLNFEFADDNFYETLAGNIYKVIKN